MSTFTDADFQGAMRRSVRMGTILAAVALPLVWWKMGWPSAALLAIGAVISVSGLWEWRRLMSAVAAQMDAQNIPEGEEGKRPSMGYVLAMFFLRLGLVVVVLYVTLKYLQGSVFALAAGLMTGVFALTIQSIRLLKSWTE